MVTARFCIHAGAVHAITQAATSPLTATNGGHR
jgi:hypothetical protein